MLKVMTAPPVIRPYRPEDRAALARVCVLTADDGGDARHLYPDPELLPSIFATPYAVLEPELTFVLDAGAGPVGYILGTADTARFVTEFRERWLPTLRKRFPPPAGPPATLPETMIDLLHHPERMLRPELAGHPAHLHIDLLPEYQGQGYGRRLMSVFLNALHRRGVAKVHLGVSPANTGARAFYDRLGFHEIPVPALAGSVTYLGRATWPLPGPPG